MASLKDFAVGLPEGCIIDKLVGNVRAGPENPTLLGLVAVATAGRPGAFQSETFR